VKAGLALSYLLKTPYGVGELWKRSEIFRKRASGAHRLSKGIISSITRNAKKGVSAVDAGRRLYPETRVGYKVRAPKISMDQLT